MNPRGPVLSKYSTCFLLIAFLGFVGTWSSKAADSFWLNIGGGLFSTPANWSGGMPGTGDNATFTNNATYQVSWSTPAANADARFAGGTVTQAIGSSWWHLTNSYVLGENSGSTGSVVHVSGSLIVTNPVGNAMMQIGLAGRGTYALNGGSITTDYLFATNNAAGYTNSSFLFNYGTLNTSQGSTIRMLTGNNFSMGTVSGQAATWNIFGGTNYLLIEGNAGHLIGVSGGRGVVNVSGPGTFLSTPSLFIGSSGPDSHLTIRDRACVQSVLAILGFTHSASNSMAVVEGAGSTWTNTGELYVGFSSREDQLIVTNSGRFSSGRTVIGHSQGFNLGHNNTVKISGSGSVWTNYDQLTIGSGGSGNQLLVENGGRVDNQIAYIGFGIFQSNCAATVNGPGSLWKNTGLYVGYTGTNHQLTINGGGVIATNLIVGRNSSAVGSRLTLNNGLLQVTNTLVVPGILEIRRGTLTMSDGVLTADRLLFTNALANFSFTGGRINSKGTDLTTGAPLTVGNGTTPATLNLDGGTHNFSGGLNLSPNSTLTGTGAITGNVFSDGVIAPGSSIGLLTINGDLQVNSGDLVFQINGPSGQFDTLVVSSGFYCGGNLRVALANGYTPTPGNLFPLIGFTFSSGSFLNVSGGRVNTTDGRGSFLVNNDGTVLYLSDYQSADGDGDGISDSWAQLYFGISPLPASTGPNDRFGDKDGDGMNNYDEFLAGTNPLDNTSRLKLIPTVSSTNTFTLEFDGVPGRTYRLWYSTNLQNWVELPIVGFDNSSAPAMRWTDDGILTGTPPLQQGHPRFYRVSVE